MPTLSLRELVKIYHGRCVVNSVSLNVESSSVVGLLGPNGAGKTTTFYLTVGMVRPNKGQVFLDDEDITDCPMYLRARQPLSKSEQKDRANSLLEELSIKHLASQKAGVLSGGERRRLEITRALATTPSFMLLDEPFAGIDPLAVIDIKNIIRHLKRRNIGIIISDHNVRETLEVCDQAYILNNGQIIESGPPEKIASSEIARRIYLGDEFRL
ncbi:MAG: ATP-binding cassette domain-containing protein [Deltaproteobacteria bacterium]|nr:ATP-binding cassette domain-containing protein [Deltaproteobacteria bacterium]